MRRCILAAWLAVCALALPPAAAGPSPLTDEDRKLFAWFDGIGLPSCAGKRYVRVRWVQEGTSEATLEAANVWELDGFVVAEGDGRMTVLDGDLWPRKVGRQPSPGWTGGVTDLDLKRVAALAVGRLHAMRTDPGAVEAMHEIYRGIRLRFGDEGQSLALARHCAANGLEREAHDLLEAARRLPPTPETPAGATFQQIVAEQLDEGVIWRILYDFADPDIPRGRLLERLGGWSASFPTSPLQPRAADALRVLPGMVQEDALQERAKAPPSAQDLERLPPAERARHLVGRLRDQTGDVFMSRQGRVSLHLGAPDSPAQQLVALGLDAAPALVEAVSDERYTRAVLFIRDTSIRRVVVARVGDFARVILETVAKRTFWDVPEEEPSMFQHGAAGEVQERCRDWLRTVEPAPAGDEGGSR